MAKDKVHEIMDDPDEINFGCDVLSSTASSNWFVSHKNQELKIRFKN